MRGAEDVGVAGLTPRVGWERPQRHGVVAPSADDVAVVQPCQAEHPVTMAHQSGHGAEVGRRGWARLRRARPPVAGVQDYDVGRVAPARRQQRARRRQRHGMDPAVRATRMHGWEGIGAIGAGRQHDRLHRPRRNLHAQQAVTL